MFCGFCFLCSHWHFSSHGTDQPCACADSVLFEKYSVSIILMAHRVVSCPFLNENIWVSHCISWAHVVLWESKWHSCPWHYPKDVTTSELWGWNWRACFHWILFPPPPNPAVTSEPFYNTESWTSMQQLLILIQIKQWEWICRQLC